MGKIVVIGSSNTDLVIRSSRIPKPGETILGGDFFMTAGGKGANQAVAIARLGGDIKFAAKVGDDMFGRQSLDGYRSDGMDISLIVIDENAPSGVALICVDENAENSIVVAPGANNNLTTSDIEAIEDHIKSASYLLMQLETPMETIELAASIAHRHGVKVILNPAPAAELSDELMGKLYLITPNETECELLTGIKIESETDVERAAEALLAKGVQNVVVTLGSEGSMIKNNDRCQSVPARKVSAVDTTAAGDTFNGGLCVALAEGKGLVEAVEFATAASAISVTRMGAQTSIPTRKEVDELME